MIAGADLEVVFSGRGFLDGRGLSGVTGDSSLAGVADRGPDTPETRKDHARIARVEARHAARVTREQRRAQKTAWARAARAAARAAHPPAGPRLCRCGCGAVLPETTMGRPFSYVTGHNGRRPTKLQRYRAARRLARQRTAA